MKTPKILWVVLTIGIIVSIIGIIAIFDLNFNNTIQTSSDGKLPVSSKKLTAEDVINKMKDENLNIGKTVVYTEDDDPNNLLGRPNQYTSKIRFEDIRIEQLDYEGADFIGGSIEVFQNEKDMSTRKEYIESFSSVSMFAEYIYSKNNILLRIDKDLSPSQAKEYEELLNKIIK